MMSDILQCTAILQHSIVVVVSTKVLVYLEQHLKHESGDTFFYPIHYTPGAMLLQYPVLDYFHQNRQYPSMLFFDRVLADPALHKLHQYIQAIFCQKKLPDIQLPVFFPRMCSDFLQERDT